MTTTSADRFYDPNDGEIEYLCTPDDFRPGSADVLALLLEVDEPTAPAPAPKKPVSSTKAKVVVPSERPKSTFQRRPYSKDVCVAYMSVDERRDYNNERKRASRDAAKAKLTAQNAVTYNADTARDALADAAIMLLAQNLPGSDAIRHYLAAVFHTQPGAPLTLEGRIKTGAMRPKLLRYAKPAKT